MKILIIGEHPSNKTGFGKVTSQIYDFLHIRHQTKILAYYVHNQPAEKHIIHSMNPNILLGADKNMIADDKFGRYTAAITMKTWQPEIVLTVGDIWNFGYIERLRAIHPNVVFISYYPMECAEQPANIIVSLGGDQALIDIRDMENAYTYLVAYSAISQKLLPNADDYVYHAMDPKETEADEYVDLSFFEDKFVVGSIFRTQYRKGIDQMLLAMVHLRNIYPQAYEKTILYFHTARMDMMKIDIPMMIKRLGLQDHVIMANDVYPEIFMTNGIPNPVQGLSRGQLNRLIRRFDAYLSLSYGEGFCLPLIEAAALGVKVIHHDFLTMGEIMKDIGEPVKSITTFMEKINQRTFYMPDAKQAAQIIADMVLKKATNDRSKEINDIIASRFSYKVIGPKWESIVEKATDKHRPDTRNITVFIYQKDTQAEFILEELKREHPATLHTSIRYAYGIAKDSMLLASNPKVVCMELIYARNSIRADHIKQLPTLLKVLYPNLKIHLTILHDFNIIDSLDTAKYDLIRLPAGCKHNLKVTKVMELAIPEKRGVQHDDTPWFIGSNETNEGVIEAIAAKLPVIIRKVSGTGNIYEHERFINYAKRAKGRYMLDTDLIDSPAKDLRILYWSNHQPDNDFLIRHLMNDNQIIGGYLTVDKKPHFNIDAQQFNRVTEFIKTHKGA